MYPMEQYKKPEKTVVDISTWSRRDNFEFFRDFFNPNLGVTVRVDVSHAYSATKAVGDVTVSGVSPDVYEILDVTGFTSILNVKKGV